MKQKTKQLIMTLVALLALTTGARAQWTGGTYTAKGNENLNTINVSDDATLTINQGVIVTVSGGIVVADGKTLTITGGGTLVANGAEGEFGDRGQTGTPGGTAIAGNVIINGVGLTVTATGGKGGDGGRGDYGSDGRSEGETGGNGGNGGKGANAGSAFSDAVTIYAGSVTATGGLGGRGGQGGQGGQGGEGGDGGQGGDGGNGGNGGYAFAGTLTVFGGNVSAYGGHGGNPGDGGEGGHPGDSPAVSSGNPGKPGNQGYMRGENGRAYANSVTFEVATYTVKDYYGDPIDINIITSHQEVIIQSADVVPATATPVPLTWDAATPNTATLTNGMPAGNVTVSVEYFPQAEFAMSTDPTPVALAPAAIDGVPANTDDPIVTAGTVANIGTSVDKQGTLMYFVSQSTDNTVPDAPDYDTKGWSEDVPTANGLAEGNAYVWYYIKGAEPAQGTDRTDDNTRSDSDIMPLGTNGIVTLLPEPTYNVEFAEGSNPEAPAEPEWTATPNTGVKKGQTVTVTYTGDRKVIGVKAEKKAKAKPLANATNEDLGKVVGADGKIYANKDAAEAVATGNAVAMICYVKEGHGLALALTDEGDMDWSTAKTTCNAHTPAVTGATWKLASLSEMSLMINAAGNYVALRDGFSAVGGTNMIDEYYWLSDESSADYAKNINFGGGYDSQEFKTDAYKVRACLEW